MLGFGHTVDDLERILSHRNCVILFHHIHKTAGSTIEFSLAHQFGDQAFRCQNANQRSQLADFFASSTGTSPRFIFGHGTKGIENDLEQFGVFPDVNLFRFTFLRNPRTRCESLFNFMALRDLHFDKTFSEYVASAYPSNPYCKFLNTNSPAKFLRDNIEFVGTQERFLECTSILLSVLNIKIDQMMSRTVNPNPKRRMLFSNFKSFFKNQTLDYKMFELCNIAVDQYLHGADVKVIEDYLDEDSFSKKTELNTDLEENQDTYSLFATGMHLLKEEEHARAKQFLEKACQINFGLFRKVETALSGTAEHVLSELRMDLREFYANSNDKRVRKKLFTDNH